MNYFRLISLAILTNYAVSNIIRNLNMNAPDGSQYTVIFNHPYQLQLTTENDISCGASILAVKFALTAAQCVFEIEQVTLRAGATYWGVGGIVHTSVKIIIHPKFNEKTHENDIAVIKVTPEFRIGLPGIKAVTIPYNEPEIGVSVEIAGWSSGDKYGAPNPLQIKVFFSNIMSRKACKSYLSRISWRVLCSLTMSYTDCGGELGGALVTPKTFEQIGIAIKNTACSPSSPEVYTNVALFRAWILSQIE